MKKICFDCNYQCEPVHITKDGRKKRYFCKSCFEKMQKIYIPYKER